MKVFLILAAFSCLLQGLFRATFSTPIILSQLPLRTQGRWIVDRQGKRVKLSCVNWHGAHMNTFVPSGLHFQTAKKISGLLQELGFNCVRLQWSVEMVLLNPPINPEAIKALIESGQIDNQVPARALDIFDMVINDLAEQGIMTIIDNHMSNAGWCCDVRDGNGLWFNEKFGHEDWLRAWEFMASRYAQQPFVIGGDLRNELRPDIRIKGPLSIVSLPRLEIRMPVWGGGNRQMALAEYSPEITGYTSPHLTSIRHNALLWTIKKALSSSPIQLFDWHNASNTVANMIARSNPNMLVFIQGVFDIHSYVPNVMQVIFFYLKNDESLYNAIGRFFDIPDEVTKVYQMHNLTGIASLPILMNEPNRLVYSSHFYPFFYAGSQYRWDGLSPTFADFDKEVDKYWGYIFKQEKAPVWVGEVGYHSDRDVLESSWTNYTLRYLLENDLDTAYWPIGDSRPVINQATGAYEHGFDEYGMLNGNYTEVKSKLLYDSVKQLFATRLGPPMPFKRTQNTQTVEVKDDILSIQ